MAQVTPLCVLLVHMMNHRDYCCVWIQLTFDSKSETRRCSCGIEFPCTATDWARRLVLTGACGEFVGVPIIVGLLTCDRIIIFSF